MFRICNIIIMRNPGVFLLVILAQQLYAQSGIIRGKVYNGLNNEAIPFANVVIEGTTNGAVSDDEGKYEIKNLQAGLYNLKVSYIGFEDQTVFEIRVSNARPEIVDIALKEATDRLDEVTVTATPFRKSDESPLSKQSIGPDEIRRAPGANRDLSQVVRTLPGVTSTVSFRNDIIIRGGASSENKFYLDGVEIPVINHFQTQGASGGPVGLINVDLIRRVDFYSGAFPSNRGNALSSVFEFVQKDGRDDQWTMNAIVGASDLGITVEGPVTEKSSLIFSIRRSYLQFIFKALELPFLPVYNDYQFKYKYNFDEKNKLTVLSIGALDDFELNLEANDTEEQRYLLNNLPVFNQWNYTIGGKYERFRDKGYSTLVVSRSMLNNRTFKYRENDDSNPDNLIQDYVSQEIENKLRFEDYFEQSGYRVNVGINYEYARYNVNSFFQFPTPEEIIIQDFESDLTLHKWGVFGTVSRDFFDKNLVLSLGIRADANDYSEEMNNMFDQLSPRFSASYYLTNQFTLNFNAGRYYQLPAYTVLGYRNTETGVLENRANGVRYIQSDHLVAGLEYVTLKNTKFSIEGFYKWYDHYPFLLQDSISLANVGADFGVVGNAPVSSIGKGRAYGLELLAQQKLSNGLYGLLAYTLVRSEFTDRNEQFVPSSWDFGHVVSVTGGYKFGKNWELGARWLFTGAAPFTPYDIQASVRRENWLLRGQGIFDYTQLNSQRLRPFHQLDLRVDKKFFFDRWTLNLYFDVQNAYNYQTPLQDNIDVVRDSSGRPLEDPNNPGSFIPRFLTNEVGIVLPTLGVIIEI